MSSTRTTTSGPGLIERFFELRMIIAVLFGVYGVACFVWGLAFTTQEELDKAAGINVNLFTGVGMFLVSAAFVTWALLNPLVQERTEEGEPPA